MAILLTEKAPGNVLSEADITALQSALTVEEFERRLVAAGEEEAVAKNLVAEALALTAEFASEAELKDADLQMAAPATPLNALVGAFAAWPPMCATTNKRTDVCSN